MTLTTRMVEMKEEGVEADIEIGEQRKAVETARNMLEDGIVYDKITLYTGLPLETVEKLAQQIKVAPN